MSEYKFSFTGQIQVYPGESGWHFVYLPTKLSKQLSEQFHGLKRGWGSLKVKALVGETSWETSLFPDSKSKTYLLAIKQAVRKKEHLFNGSKITILIQILL